jgi:hypothetical protein
MEITNCTHNSKLLFTTLTMALLSLFIHSLGTSLEDLQLNPKKDSTKYLFQWSQIFPYLLLFTLSKTSTCCLLTFCSIY